MQKQYSASQLIFSIMYQILSQLDSPSADAYFAIEISNLTTDTKYLPNNE